MKPVETPDARVDAAVDTPVDMPLPMPVTLTTAIGTAPQNLAFVAGQAGDGPWEALTGTGGVYTLQVLPGRFAFAYTCPGGAVLPEVGIFAAATSELSSHAVSCAPTTAVTVNGSVTNVPGADTADVVFADNVVQPGQLGPTVTYSHAIPPGRYTIGVGFAPSSTGVTDNRQFILDRGVDVTANATRNYDFANAFALDTRTIAVDGGNGTEDVTSFAGLLTDGGYVPTSSTVNLNPIDVHNVPAAHMQGGDLIRLGGFASDPAAGTTRSTWFYTTSPDDVALLLPGLITSSVSIPSTSPVLFRADLGHPPYQAHYVVAAQSTVRWNAVVTAGWFGTATDRVFTTPDLTGVTGWDPALDLVAGAAITYDVTNAACSQTVIDLLNEANGSASAGLSMATTRQHGQITP